MTSEFRGKTNELDSEEDQYNGREENPRKTKNFLHLPGDKMMTKTQEKHFHRQNKKIILCLSLQTAVKHFRV